MKENKKFDKDIIDRLSTLCTEISMSELAQELETQNLSSIMSDADIIGLQSDDQRFYRNGDTVRKCSADEYESIPQEYRLDLNKAIDAFYPDDPEERKAVYIAEDTEVYINNLINASWEYMQAETRLIEHMLKHNLDRVQKGHLAFYIFGEPVCEMNINDMDEIMKRLVEHGYSIRGGFIPHAMNKLLCGICAKNRGKAPKWLADVVSYKVVAGLVPVFCREEE